LIVLLVIVTMSAFRLADRKERVRRAHDNVTVHTPEEGDAAGGAARDTDAAADGGGR
jgi:hypothetical protein